MAKIFRTESLSLNADFIRLTADSSENFEFKNSSGSIIMSRATIESDISSLALDGRNQDSDVSSLASGLTQEGDERDSDVSSLASGLTQEEDERDSDVSSLASGLTQEENERDSDVSSLAAAITDNDVVAVSQAIASGDISEQVEFGRTFASTPTVVATLQSSDGNDPIMGAQISAITTSDVTVVFSDEMPSANYKVEILASI